MAKRRAKGPAYWLPILKQRNTKLKGVVAKWKKRIEWYDHILEKQRVNKEKLHRLIAKYNRKMEELRQRGKRSAMIDGADSEDVSVEKRQQDVQSQVKFYQDDNKRLRALRVATVAIMRGKAKEIKARKAVLMTLRAQRTAARNAFRQMRG